MSSSEVIGQVTTATDVDTLNVNVDTASHSAPPPPPPWQLIDLQDCLHDSPQFRRMLSMKEQELNDLERRLEKIVTMCSTMVDSGQIYRENCRLFSLSLKELSDHFTDLPSVKDAFARFCEIFNEIQTYYRVLFDQAQRTVMKGLKDFLTGDLRKVHNSQKSFHKTSTELSYVLHKNATTSRQKPSEADEMSSLLQTMQVEFTHQALDYCYQINVVSCLKCHRITEKLVSFLGATSTFFHQGHDSLKCLDPYLREVVQEMDGLQTQSTTDINYMRDRHSLVSSQHMQEDFTEIPMDNISLPIVFRGYLFKRSHNAFKSWNRRYCELRDNKLFYLKKNSEDDYGTIAEDLRLCTVKLADELERRFCFEVVTPRRSCMLQADSEMDRRKWCMYLEAGIARALRVTSSNKSRELKRRLTSTAISTLPNAAELSSERLDSPLLHRTDSPSSVVSNASCSFDFLDVPGNEFCADCSRATPKWASLNIGILLCIDCSGIHRSLGVHISKVRSTTLDDWEPEHQKIMSVLGNDRVNSIYEFEVPSYVRKPTVNTSASDREEYIRMKYVDRAFVHPHPNFNRPTVPVPPPRIQGTLLRAAVTSPKLAGRLNRPISMSTGLTLDQHLSPAASPVPSSRSPLNSESGESSPLGGLNLRPESMALLEENWKKLEKNGRLQQWNLKSMYNVVKSPRKTFNLTKFARPGSFRRKKSPLVSDDYSHSDNELEDPLPFFHTTQSQSHSVSPNLPNAPQKPPRTYTTTLTQIENAPTSNPLFKKEGDDFSSDLLSTLDRLGSVYSISGLLKDEMDGNGDEYLDLPSHPKIQRSVSVQLQAPQITTTALPVPKIAVVSNTFEGEVVTEEEDLNQAADTHLNTSRSSLGRELSRSVGSLPSLDIGNVGMSTAAHPQHETEEVVLTLSDDHNEDITSGHNDTLKDRTLRNIDLSHYLPEDDDSSVDSYQSAEDRNDLVSRYRSEDSPPLEIKRPDSEASELFHTPPNSPSPSPTGLESISPSHITNIGLALGVNITLQDSQSSTKLPDTFNQHALGDLTTIGGDLHNAEDEEDEEGARSSIKDNRLVSTDSKPLVEDDSPPSVKNESSPNEESINSQEMSAGNPSPIHTNIDHGSPIAVEEAVDLETPSKTSADILYNNAECVDPYSEYDVHIIPDDISPSKFLFECSLNGDLGGILSGIAHGGLINQPITEEGSKYPIHQACITGNETTVEFLYQNGAKLNVTDNRGCTPLHLVAMNGYVSLVAILIKHGVDHTILDKEGKSSLMYATARQNADIVAILKLAEAGNQLESDECYEEDTKILMEESVAALLHKNSPEVDSIKSRSLSSTNSSSSTDKVNSGSELSMCSVNKVSDLVLNSKSKQDT